MATRVEEIARDVYRISTYDDRVKLQFNQFVVKDDQPLLFHTGMRSTFPQVRDAVASVLDPASLRWIGFSHYEPDECGALNEWLTLAPNAQAFSSFVGVNVCLSDFAIRPARAMTDNEVLATGKKRFRFLSTPRVPHAWEAALLFEESGKTLFCSDLFTHGGDVEPIASSGVVQRARDLMVEFQKGPLANYLPYTPNTDPIIRRLANLKPATLAIMHGSSFQGDGEAALLDLAKVLKEVLGG
jgi:flavorubredoxin